MARGLIVAVVIAVVAAACAEEEPAFDPADVLSEVQAATADVGVVDVECDGLDALVPVVGGVVACRGTLSGDPVELTATVGAAIEGEIAVSTEVDTPLFDVAIAEAAAAGRLGDELGGAPEVDCDERVVVIAPGRRIACRVTAEGGTAGPVDRPLAIVLTDAEANWELDFTP